MGFVPIPRLAPGARFGRALAASAIGAGFALFELTAGAAAARATPPVHVVPAADVASLSASSTTSIPRSIRTPDAGLQALTGRVLQATSPVVEARVFAYQLVERSIEKVVTDSAGRFLFESLPAGIYKIIAHKPGFTPAVLLLKRTASDESQQVTLELQRETAAARSDYWTARSEIPGDVLRELNSPTEQHFAWMSGDEVAGDDADISGSASKLRAEVAAITGIEEVKPDADVRISGGNVDVIGRLGAVKLFLEGDFQSFETTAARTTDQIALDGSTRSVSLSLETPNQGVFDIESSSNQLLTAEGGQSLPVEASQYRFGWNRNVGENGETSFRGIYVEESGLYNKGYVEPVDLPFASRTLLLEGNYTHKLDAGKLRAGLRYRERSALYSQRITSLVGDDYVAEFLEAFGGGDWQANDTVLLEYGLFTTLRDGSVSLTPRGGVVLRLGGAWQASATVAHRVEVDADPLIDDFRPVFLDGALDCSQSELACYEVGAQRGGGDGDNFAFGASFRELDSTVRMFYSTNFFDHTEGLFLVPGDRLPEAHAAYRKRLTPSIVARATASYADGGGGIYRAVNRRLFENNVSLVSTSLDTSFESTATGVFVAFHRVEQKLVPFSPIRRGVAPTTAGLERLEVVVNQDLSTLLDLSTGWAVRLGMELARGASFFHSDVDPDELRRQIMTGVAVRF